MVVQSTGSSSFSSSSAAATAAPASQPSVGFFICERAAQDKNLLLLRRYRAALRCLYCGGLAVTQVLSDGAAMAPESKFPAPGHKWKHAHATSSYEDATASAKAIVPTPFFSPSSSVPCATASRRLRAGVGDRVGRLIARWPSFMHVSVYLEAESPKLVHVFHKTF